MPVERMRMRPWLEEQIEGGLIPGLVWLDKESKIFQIPWIHAARHGWDLDKDAPLFMNWAIHTGKYHPGVDRPDPKTWKANFRCAMNSLPDIEEVKDKSTKKGTNAFKVYRILSPVERAIKKGKKKMEKALGPKVPPPANITDETPIYVVRRLLDVRQVGCELKYLVDWEGCGPEERSWVCQKDILDPAVIEQFYDSYPNLPETSRTSPQVGTPIGSQPDHALPGEQVVRGRLRSSTMNRNMNSLPLPEAHRNRKTTKS